MHPVRIIFCFFICFLTATPSAIAEFPSKPLRIVVYTQPGGLIDITARKVANILQKKYVNKPVIVENKKGAGGIVALSHVLRQPADGHTIFGLTSSVVSKLVAAKKDSELSKLHFLARMAEDYECLIVRKDSAVANLAELVTNAQAAPGKQIWAGPASGGTDHLFAMKFWSAAEIKARWIPYRSGSEAIAAVLGKHADVYVGNPGDVLGRPDLKVLAVSSPERLKLFKDAATFKEENFESFSNESLWRGFAVRKETPEEATQQLESLFLKVSKDPEWLEFLNQADITPTFDTHSKFSEMVQAQVIQDKDLISSLS